MIEQAKQFSKRLRDLYDKLGPIARREAAYTIDALVAEVERLTLRNANVSADNGALRAEVESLRKDAERMDWLDQRACIASWIDGEPTKMVIDAASGDQFTGDTWREAIDAAIAKIKEVQT